MIPPVFNLDPASMAAPLRVKLSLIRSAGFAQTTIWAEDIVSHPEGVAAAVAEIRASGLRVAALQVLRDFEGRSGSSHAYKVDIAKDMLGLCRSIGARLLIVCSTTQSGVDSQRVVGSLRTLANLAVPLGVRIGYKAVPWAGAVRDVSQAWETCWRVDHANFGLVLDSAHMLMSGWPSTFFDEVDAQRIALVQLADFAETIPLQDSERKRIANHGRVFPGDGEHSADLSIIVRALDRCGYRGDYSFLVMNDDYRQLPATTVIDHARRSVTWVADQVLRRSLPLRTSRAL
jgi:sugar phosphate isomerase/epimerase